MAHRVRYHFNRHIQWFHPPMIVGMWGGEPAASAVGVDQNGGITGLDPELWATEVGFLVDRVWSSAVGRAVTRCVRRRTTIYPADRPQTDVDPYDDAPDLVPNERVERVAREATTSGTNAIMFFNLHSRTVRVRDSLQWDPVLSLLHELVHAVNITWGNFQIRTAFTPGEARRLGVSSPEEEIAWVIDNMHRSERGLWLRRQYDDSPLLPPGSALRPDTTGTDLRASEGRVVARVGQRVGMLASALEQIDERTCPYNPFRENARRPAASRR